MTHLDQNDLSVTHPFPKYLIDQVSRQIIADLEDRGLHIALAAPAHGSVTVLAKIDGGTTIEEMGRPECLPDLLAKVAARCGIDIDTF